MAERVISYSNLTNKERDEILSKKINWSVSTLSGQEFEMWSEGHDARYGKLKHVAIFDQETGRFLYDKVDLDWSPAAFVVVYRRKNDRIEFLLPSERRVLLKDQNGVQGNVSIRNIPQGLVKTWAGETIDQAALREVKEEVGIEPKSIQKMENLYFDAANSQTAMPFFLAEVDASELQTYQQNLDPDENIKVSEKDWFAIEDIQKLKIQCAKTLSGLLLATGFLGIWPKSK